MCNSQLIKNATLTTAVVSIISLSSLFGANSSQALTLNVPLENFTFDNAEIVSTDTTFSGYFTEPYILINTQGSATSVVSPFVFPNQIKSVFLEFQYAFSSNAPDSLFELLLNNETAGTSASISQLPTTIGTNAIFDTTPYITTPGTYSFIYQVSGGVAGFNHFVLNVKQVPEPTNTIGLLALGIGFFALKTKRKVKVGV